MATFATTGPSRARIRARSTPSLFITMGSGSSRCAATMMTAVRMRQNFSVFTRRRKPAFTMPLQSARHLWHHRPPGNGGRKQSAGATGQLPLTVGGNFSSPNPYGNGNLTGLSYAFDYKNARFVLVDQFTPAPGNGAPNQAYLAVSSLNADGTIAAPGTAALLRTKINTSTAFAAPISRQPRPEKSSSRPCPTPMAITAR